MDKEICEKNNQCSQAEDKLNNHSIAEKPLAHEKNIKAIWILLLMIIVLPTGMILCFHFIDNNANEEKDLNITFPSLPELPDAIAWYDGNDNIQLADVQNKKYDIGYDGVLNGQIGTDGTIVTQKMEKGDVHIYKNGTESIIPGPIEYFSLCGSGEKIVYGSGWDSAYLWVVARNKSKLISENAHVWGISYNGRVLNLDLGKRYSIDGKEPQWVSGLGYIVSFSEDGKYIYYDENCIETSVSDETERHYSTFNVLVNGVSHEIWNYSGFIIAHSADYEEILFGFHNDVYYFSMDLAKKNSDYKARQVYGGGKGMLLPLEDVNNISDWVYNGYKPFDIVGHASHSIINNVYCLLSEENGVYSASIVKLDEDMKLREIIPNVNGCICFSQDGTKLWCIADNRVAFYDLFREDSAVCYCNVYTEDCYDDNNLAVTSDGLKACFVGEDGAAWICTPETIEHPSIVMEDIAFIQCSFEDKFYEMTRDYIERSRRPIYDKSGRGCSISVWER